MYPQKDKKQGQKEKKGRGNRIVRRKKRKEPRRKRRASVALLRDDAVLEPQVEAAFVLVIAHRGLELREETAEDVLAEEFLPYPKRYLDGEDSGVALVEEIALDEILCDVEGLGADVGEFEACEPDEVQDGADGDVGEDFAALERRAVAGGADGRGTLNLNVQNDPKCYQSRTILPGVL